MEQTLKLGSLKNHFLIAMPSLMEPYFFHSVTYICEHTEEHSIGIIINQPLSNIRLGDVLAQMQMHTPFPEIAAQMIFSGGPVHPERGFVLHNIDARWHNTIDVGSNLALSTSSDILKAISLNTGPARFLVALGYAHWRPGQLEQEIANNDWLFGPANDDIIFNMAIEYRWRAAAALMGIDVNKLSDDIGHA